MANKGCSTALNEQDSQPIMLTMTTLLSCSTALNEQDSQLAPAVYYPRCSTALNEQDSQLELQG